jgi:putative phage-type endonuclease
LSFYLIDDLEQGSMEWLNWRRGVIGASDAATIMGENPWASSRMLLEEKLGQRRTFSGNAATREGNKLEEFGRASLEKKYRHKIMPTVVQDSQDPFFAASLDGIDSSKTRVYEIKCGLKSYEKTRDTGKVPDYYVAQLQHMMMVTQLNSLIFAAYRPEEELISFEVERDERYIKRLRKKEFNFIQELKRHGHDVQYEFRGYRVQ